MGCPLSNLFLMNLYLLMQLTQHNKTAKKNNNCISRHNNYYYYCCYIKYFYVIIKITIFIKSLLILCLPVIHNT